MKVMTMEKITEVNIDFVKPNNGLIGFASIVIDKGLYLGSIAIHKKLDGTGYRLTYPTKDEWTLFHPINSQTSGMIEHAVFEKLNEVMRKVKKEVISNDRYNSSTSA